MKSRPVLVTAIILTILVELILMLLVYNKVGAERLPFQIGRLTVQLVLILWVISKKSNTGLFLLVAYHILTGFFGFSEKGSTTSLGQLLIGFHFIIGFIMYLHEWIERKIRM